MHLLLQEFLIKAYKDASYVIQVDDKESGIIIAKGAYTGTPENLRRSSVDFEFSSWHIIKCEIKENRIRITVTLTKIDRYTPASGSDGNYRASSTQEYSVTELYPVISDKDRWATRVVRVGGIVRTSQKRLNAKYTELIISNEGYYFHYVVSKALNTIEAIKLRINSDVGRNDDW